MRYTRASYLRATLCALAVLLCELISRPFTTMNICDDGPYIRMAHTLANTGHIVYNGWETAMMAAQLYLAAAFIKLFGFSVTSVRMSTLLLAVLTAFVFHRTLTRAGISERNATLGTLAVVLSPMYLMLSVTFMTDIAGLLGITLCLYGCVRALQASTDRSAIGWICFAIFTCAVFGTSRQIAWLGDLVMVPSTLWLLRSRRRVLLTGAAATAIAFLFILGCMHWLGKQPYSVPAPILLQRFPGRVALGQLGIIVFEIPFLVVPVIAVFAPAILRSRPSTRALLLTELVAYIAIAFFSRNAPDPILRFEPTAGNPGSWVNIYGVYWNGVEKPPILLHTGIQVLLTTICIAGLLGLVAVALKARHEEPPRPPAADVLSWSKLATLLLPFSLGYLILLVIAIAGGATYNIYDRYALGLLGPTMIVLVRLYQERVRPNLPIATVLLIIIMTTWGIIATHNTFALDRARVDLANELHNHGVPFTAIDGDWDYNLDTELDNADHINDPRIKVPAGAYVSPRPVPPGYCAGMWHNNTPHVHALYGISFSPDKCYGRAPFAPVQYRPWPLRTPINLYAVRYAPPSTYIETGVR